MLLLEAVMIPLLSYMHFAVATIIYINLSVNKMLTETTYITSIIAGSHLSSLFNGFRMSSVEP